LREEIEALAGGVGSESLGKTIATISNQARIFGYECKYQRINPTHI
jgi:hypothetical protein